MQLPQAPKPAECVPNAGAAKTQLISIALKDLPNPADRDDEFCHRFQDKLTEGSLEAMMESLKHDKQLEPLQVVKGKDGKWIVISGHLRLTAMLLLANRGVAGFSMDMLAQALEILETSHLALLKRSIAANEVRKKLEPKERLLAVKKLQAANATKKEMAATSAVSEKQIERDLKIVTHPRVLKHVMDDNLPTAAAAALVEVAGKVGRLEELLDHFDGWAKRTAHEIQEQDRLAKQERGKGLRPNLMLVMNHLEGHLIQGWLDALAKGKPLTEEPDLGFEATFDKKTAVATIKVKVDAKSDPVPHVARVASQISRVAQHLAAFAQKRHELEAPEGPQAALEKDEAFLDLDLLKQYGLDDLASQLESELRGGETKGTPFGATVGTDGN